MKKIVIIGGGISGLAILHYLKQILPKDATITLYERNDHVGGNIQTLSKDGFLFETGPNAFLNNQPQTLQFIKELNLDGGLVRANGGRRYVQTNDGLRTLSSALSWSGKWRALKGFLNSKVSKDQSIDAYARERFGSEVAERLFDPFASGVYAGDAKRLHMASCSSNKRKIGAVSLSLKGGMGDLIKRLQERYHEHIELRSQIEDLGQFKAKHIVCTIPAYAAGDLCRVNALNSIAYAPVAVVGLGFAANAFRRQPDGYGYLVPSSQGKDVLGVLFESNVFESRAPQGMIMLRVMMGGRRHPGIAGESTDALVVKALQELDKVYGLQEEPKVQWVKLWPKAIPQYEMDYPKIITTIRQSMVRFPNLTLAGNYLGGVSFNDCVYNAKTIAQHCLSTVSVR